MKRNPRLIQLNRGTIRTITSTFCGVIAREAKEYLQNFPDTEYTPLALLEDVFYANRTFEVENARTGRGFDLALRAEAAEMNQRDIEGPKTRDKKGKRE